MYIIYGTSVACQAVDWQGQMWTAIFTNLFFFTFLFSVVNVSHAMAALIKTCMTRSQEAACIPIFLLGRGITMELIYFLWCFYTILICYTFFNVFSFFVFFIFCFCFSEYGIAQLRSKHGVG